jgi:hypothetical protein
MQMPAISWNEMQLDPAIGPSQASLDLFDMVMCGIQNSTIKG